MVVADGWGSSGDSLGELAVWRPAGGEVVAAWVVLAGSPEAGDPGAGSVAVGGVPLALDEVGEAGVGPMWARWGEVTDDLRPTLDALPDGASTLPIEELGLDPVNTEGVGMVLVWADPARAVGSVAIWAGATDLFDGAFFGVEVDATGLTGAELGLGIAFSSGGAYGQAAGVTVNGAEVAGEAGGYDDGAFANGALFSLGGEGDGADGERWAIGSAVAPSDIRVDVSVVGPEVDDYLVAAWLRADGVTLSGASWCGDGVVDAGEACDDGNDDHADACSNLCRLGEIGDTGGGHTGDTGSDDTGSDDTGSDDTGSDDTGSDDTAPDESGDTSPGDTDDPLQSDKLHDDAKVGTCGCSSARAPSLWSLLAPLFLLLRRSRR